MGFHIPYRIKAKPLPPSRYGFSFVRYFLNSLAFLIVAYFVAIGIAIFLALHAYS